MHTTIDRLRLLRGIALAAVLMLSAACGGAAQTEQTEASPSATAAASSGPADVLATFIDAYNADDLDGVMAVFTDDSVINNHPFRDEARGVDEIRGILLNERATARDDDPYQISDVQVDGNTVSWNHVWVEGTGQEWCAEGHSAVVEDGAIVEWDYGSLEACE